MWSGGNTTDKWFKTTTPDNDKTLKLSTSEEAKDLTGTFTVYNCLGTVSLGNSTQTGKKNSSSSQCDTPLMNPF